MRMRAFGLAVVAAAILGTAAIAADTRFERSLKMLAPEERLEQLCDYTAMTRIRNEAKQFRPDRAVAGASSEPKVAGNTLEVVDASTTFTTGGFVPPGGDTDNRLFATSGANVLSPGGTALVPGPNLGQEDGLTITFTRPISEPGGSSITIGPLARSRTPNP